MFCSCQLELQTTAELVVAFLLQHCGGDDWNLSGRANQNAGEVLHHTNRGGETSRGDHVDLVTQRLGTIISTTMAVTAFNSKSTLPSGYPTRNVYRLQSTVVPN